MKRARALTPGAKMAPARRRPSLQMRAIAGLLRLRGKELDPLDIVRAKLLARKTVAAAPVSDKVRTAFAVSERTVGGFPVVTVAPKAQASAWHILYLHGGGYVMDLVKPHWSIVAELVRRTGATVTVPLYPLAPEHDNRQAFAFLTEVYRQLLESTPPASLVLAGDSAGGGLAVGLAIEAREQGLPMPARLILFAPWLDLSLADPAAREVERRDVMLTVDALRLFGTWWAGGDDPRAPRLSPLHADLTGLPPIDLYQGDRDLLAVDARTFRDGVVAAGGTVRYFEYPGAFHVFMGAVFLPESRDVFRRIAKALISADTAASEIALRSIIDNDTPPV